MALTPTRIVSPTPLSTFRGDAPVNVTVTDVTGEASYPTGGSPLTAAQLGLSSVLWSQAEIRTAAAAGGTIDATYDEVAGKLKLNAAAAEVANATNVAALVVRVTAYGKV